MSHAHAPHCALLALLLLAPAAASGADVEQVDNPAYLSWTKHKPGTTVDTQMTVAVGGQNMTMTIARELLAIEKDHALVEATTTMAVPGAPPNKGQKNKMKIAAKVPKGQEELPEGATGSFTMAGNEKIEVAGKAYHCRVVDFTGTAQGMKSAGKIWNSDAMPGSMVKMDMTAETPSGPTKMTMLVVSVAAK